MSLKEISEKSGLHPSTAHRILNDLATGRFADRSQPGSYRLGMRLLELGNLVKGRLNVRDAALGPMRELHQHIQQTRQLEHAPRRRDHLRRARLQRTLRHAGGARRSGGGHRCTSPRWESFSWPQTTSTAYAPTLPEPVCRGIPKTASRHLTCWSASYPGFANTAKPTTTKSSNSGVRCMTAGIYDDQNKLGRRLVHICTLWTSGRCLDVQTEGNSPEDIRDLGARSLKQTASRPLQGAALWLVDAVRLHARVAGKRRSWCWCCSTTFQPAPHAFSVGNATEFSSRVEKNKDQFAPRHTRLHHQTLTRLGDVPCLLQSYVPGGALHKPVGIVVSAAYAALPPLGDQ